VISDFIVFKGFKRLFDISKVSIILVTIPKFNFPIMPASSYCHLKVPDFEPSYP